MARACIIADGEGVRSRRFGGWRFIPWDGVSDYYEKLPTKTQRSSSGRLDIVIGLVVEASSQKFGLNNLWSNSGAFRKLVEERASNSIADQWEIKRTRVIDPWPRVFDYDTQENRWAPRIWLKLFLVFVADLLIMPALQLSSTANLIGWTTTGITAGFYLLLVGSVGAILWLFFAQCQRVSRRKSERITVDLAGIIFENGTQRLEADWVDITGYKIKQSEGLSFRYVVETRQGDFDFLSVLGNAELLQEIIRRFSMKSANTEWRMETNLSNALGGEAARWSSGKIGVGARLFHYKTRGNRAALLGMAFLGFVCLLLVASVGFGWLPGTVPLPGAAVGGIFWAAILILGWRAYLRNGIAIDDKGLTQRTLFGSKYLAWDQVSDYRVSQEIGYKIIGRTGSLGFGSEIVGCEELKAEIAQRATACGGKDWEPRPTRSVLDGR